MLQFSLLQMCEGLPPQGAEKGPEQELMEFVLLLDELLKLVQIHPPDS